MDCYEENNELLVPKTKHTEDQNPEKKKEKEKKQFRWLDKDKYMSSRVILLKEESLCRYAH